MFGVFHQSANSGRRKSQQHGGTGNAAGNHYRSEDLDLAKNQHLKRLSVL
jgi:hypothetical protein